MQVWKKAFSLLLAFALLLSCCPAITLTASAADVKGELITTITFGADGSASHADGNSIGASKSYTENGYKLALTNCTNIYAPARDAKGNSAIKFGSSKAAGSLSFTVADEVTFVVLRLAKYKANASKYSINGGAAVALTKNSNDGEYDEIVVDTTTTKKVTVASASGGIRMMMDSVSFYKAASTEEPEETEPVVTEPVETEAPTGPSVPETEPTEAPTVPSEPEETIAPTEPAPEGLLAEFTFGANGAAAHVDGNTLGTSKSYTEGDYTLKLTGLANVYGPAYDAKGNSAIKFGTSTSSKTGTLTFEVPEEVNSVELRVAKYKTNTTKCTVNGTSYTLTKNSNDGEYDVITVNTSEIKTITLATVAGSQRMMMDSIRFFSNGGVAPEPPVTEPTEPADPDGTPLTIPKAIEMGKSRESDDYTNTLYAVSGTITGVSNTQYGNLYIEDAEGNSILIYGLYQGTTRYDAMEVKPIEGDTITVWGAVGNHNGTPQLKDAQLKELIIGEHVQEPDDGTEFSIKEAVEMGAAKENNTYTTNKYKVTGVITEINNATYGNLTISDGQGNSLYIYGTYSADGETRYDKLEVKPQVGDTVTVYGILGKYNDAAQMKNGWIVEHKPMPTATVVLTPSKTEVKRGEEFTVTVSVTQAEPYTSMGFSPAVTDGMLTVVAGQCLDIVNSNAVMKDCNANDGVFQISSAQALTGDVFCFTLKVNEDAALGAAVLTGTATANNNTQPLKITLTNAEVTVVCAHETLVDFESVDNETHKYTCDDCGETFTAAHGYDDEGFCESCGWYKQYTIVYKNWDGTVLAELTGIYYDWLEYEGETPVKPADETYTYAFRGWTPEVDIVTGDAEYTAVFEPVYIDYTVTFKDHDGTVLATGTYHYGDTVTAPAPADWHDEKHVYTFSGWDVEIATVTGNAEYTACYEVNGLRGDFNGDGKISDRDALYLLRVTLEMPGFELNQSGDTNGDGNVTDADVAYLLRHVLFPHRYTLH